MSENEHESGDKIQELSDQNDQKEEISENEQSLDSENLESENLDNKNESDSDNSKEENFQNPYEADAKSNDSNNSKEINYQNPYEVDAKSNDSNDVEDVENVQDNQFNNNNNYYQDNPYDVREDISVSSDDDKEVNPQTSNHNYDDDRHIYYSQETNSYTCLEFISDYLALIITSVITLVLVIVASVLGSSNKKTPRMHIVARSLDVFSDKIMYIFWGFHSFGLVIVPILLAYLFRGRKKWYFFIWEPIMMALNMVGGFLPSKITCYLGAVELVMSIVLIIKTPFDAAYVPKGNSIKFWFGELTYMFLGFIYVSSSLSASGVPYQIFSPALVVNDKFIPKGEIPEDIHQGIKFINSLLNNPDYKVHRAFVPSHSMFILCSVGLGFAMTFLNSLGMMIPFTFLTICTFLESKLFGIILFVQLGLHVIYYLCLQFHPSRMFMAGICDFCYEYCYTTLTTVMIGDIIAFFLVILPTYALSLTTAYSKFNIGVFIGVQFAMMVGVIFHFLVTFNIRVWNVILTPLFLGVSPIIIGMIISGNHQIIRAYQFELTYLAWSFTLCLWGYANGYPPNMYIIYSILVPIGALMININYEGVGWMEITYAVIQLIFDVVLIHIAQRLETAYICWALFSVAGIAIFGVLAAVAFVLALWLITYIFAFCCECCLSFHSLEYNLNNLEIGESFECDGIRYTRTA